MYSLYTEEEKDSKLKVGCGFGISSITTRWMGNIHQGYDESLVRIQECSNTKTTFIADFLAEQQPFQHFSIALFGSYAIIPIVHYNGFSKHFTSVIDTFKNPPEKIPINLEIKEHIISYSYGKIGIGLGFHL